MTDKFGFGGGFFEGRDKNLAGAHGILRKGRSAQCKKGRSLKEEGPLKTDACEQRRPDKFCIVVVFLKQKTAFDARGGGLLFGVGSFVFISGLINGIPVVLQNHLEQLLRALRPSEVRHVFGLWRFSLGMET